MTQAADGAGSAWSGADRYGGGDGRGADGIERLGGATLSGEPLYRRRGFVETERFEDGGVPLVRMVKPIGERG